MTRGPLPFVAIREAIKNAAARGTVMDRDLLRQSRVEFIVFCAWITVFVRVRRSPLHILSPEDCAANFKADILCLRRVPLTAVIARELWLLNPWGTWQYFRVLDDRVIEIRSDGVPLLSDDARVPGVVPVREDAPKASPGPAAESSGEDT